ncbi:MAG: cytochrome C [Holophagae bacterium]|nr:cytochrome C [Holophagae bacterium]
MTVGTHGKKPLWGRLWNYANNLLTVLGTLLTTISGVLILTLAVVELAGGIRNPYVAGFAYLILPPAFILGLLLIPLGMWRRRRRLLRTGATEGELDTYPRLDFNDPHLRKVASVIIALTVANGIIVGSASYLGIEHMETVEFCGETCHSVMHPEHIAYQNSAHSRVACVQCHIGPGASWFVRSKLDGLRQVWHTALNTYHRPILTPLRTLRPARETCEACHWPAMHHGDKLRAFARFAEDEASTPSYSVMLIRTGGGTLDAGRHGGIHWWHIYSDNRIRYLAGDDRRTTMRWVELTTPDGKVSTFQREGSEPPSQAEIASQARVMDCIDCHNRPSHRYQNPAKALDELCERNEVLRTLPFFKKEALAILTTPYPTHESGGRSVREAVRARWGGGGASPERAALVAKAAEGVGAIYDRTFFPEMKTDWQTHPNHIGHDDFPGCFRCHDGEMNAADGSRAITGECENCHVFLVEESPTKPDLATLTLAGSH